MVKKVISIVIILMTLFTHIAYADNIVMSSGMTYQMDMPSGYKENGGAYGLARLARYLTIKRGATTGFVSATRIGESRYLVNLSSRDYYSNGTFVVDVYPKADRELKEGYQLWFSIYDAYGNMTNTGHAYKYKGN